MEDWENLDGDRFEAFNNTFNPMAGKTFGPVKQIVNAWGVCACLSLLLTFWSMYVYLAVAVEVLVNRSGGSEC